MPCPIITFLSFFFSLYKKSIWKHLLITYCKRRNFRTVHIFAHFARASDARKFDVSENYNHNRTNRNKQHMRENLTARICLIGLDARKFSCAKISTFTVVVCCAQRVVLHVDITLYIHVTSYLSYIICYLI